MYVQQVLDHNRKVLSEPGPHKVKYVDVSNLLDQARRQLDQRLGK